jgi:hypothetical protein
MVFLLGLHTDDSSEAVNWSTQDTVQINLAGSQICSRTRRSYPLRINTTLPGFVKRGTMVSSMSVLAIRAMSTGRLATPLPWPLKCQASYLRIDIDPTRVRRSSEARAVYILPSC